MSGQYDCTPRPWRLGDNEVDEDVKSLIIGNVGGKEVLVADCFPDLRHSATSLYLSESYRHNAAVLVEALEMYRAMLELHHWEASGHNEGGMEAFERSRAIITRIQDRWEAIENEEVAP